MNTGIILRRFIYNSPPLLKAWNHMTIAAICGFIVQFPELSCELSGGRLTMTDSLPRHHQKKYDSIVMLSVWLWYPTPGLIRSRWFSNDLLNGFMHYSCWLFFLKTLRKESGGANFWSCFFQFFFFDSVICCKFVHAPRCAVAARWRCSLFILQ